MLAHAIIPTQKFATWLLQTIDGLLDHLGLERHAFLKELIYVVIIIAASILIGICLKKLALLITNKVLTIRQSVIGAELRNRQVLLKCSRIIPPLAFMAMVPFAFNDGSPILHWIIRFAGVYTLIVFATGVNAILKFSFDRYTLKQNRQDLPLKGVLNIAIGAVWIIIGILCICILIDKSPATILAGLGAFAAALMLIFKDSILGFVAGIQMSENDMLHVGDWIVVPGTPANGNVLDVSLSTVKVLNWDLTTVMVPPYTLVSTSFQNYRSMYEANARRIMNAFTIDELTIKPATDEMIDEIVAKYPLLESFVNGLRQKGETARNVGDQRALNGTIETNAGLFRAYIGAYLNAHPLISKDQRILVRMRESSNQGIPLQIWCFTASTNWDEYEGIQSQVLEHIAACAADFGGLRIYSGNTLNVSEKEDMESPVAPTTLSSKPGTKTIAAQSVAPDASSPAQAAQ